MPSYIFIEPVPLTVSHRGTAYRIHLFQVIGSGNWRLEAEFAPAGSWFLAEAESDTRLMLAIHSSGLEINSGTLPQAIMEQLVREGRAQRIAARAHAALPPAA